MKIKRMWLVLGLILGAMSSLGAMEGPQKSGSKRVKFVNKTSEIKPYIATGVAGEKIGSLKPDESVVITAHEFDTFKIVRVPGQMLSGMLGPEGSYNLKDIEEEIGSYEEATVEFRPGLIYGVSFGTPTFGEKLEMPAIPKGEVAVEAKEAPEQLTELKKLISEMKVDPKLEELVNSLYEQWQATQEKLKEYVDQIKKISSWGEFPQELMENSIAAIKNLKTTAIPLLIKIREPEVKPMLERDKIRDINQFALSQQSSLDELKNALKELSKKSKKEELSNINPELNKEIVDVQNTIQTVMKLKSSK